ncbi:MAG: chemotaxis response regulator protein-glutamate methylesterase [Balneola sp.]|nr:chemotaxis response regulator protein-glutamate methylesterase [Balneola sp.]|tara:strand:- start:3151 stop:4212 length:1062 start_codon:yes stop_codon:yes gene_type:complete
MIRVLVVDDSEVDRKIISFALNNADDIEIVGTAENPYVAKDLIKVLKPDVITLDIQMPRMNGLTFLSKIMEYHPLPVIIVSSYSPKNSVNTLRALRLGALDTISKPGLEYNLHEFSSLLVRTIRGASEAKISSPEKNGNPEILQKPDRFSTPISAADLDSKVIAIGASTGGTRALEYVLKQLPSQLPAILIVQHLPESFTNSFAKRLNTHSDLQIAEATDGEKVKPGHVYIAPGNKHMVLEKRLSKYNVKITEGERVHYQRPSVDVLFNSVAELKGLEATGVILTGMGADGAQGLLNMKSNGAYTIGQDENSCVVYGMPKAAFEMGAVSEQVPLRNIPEKIVSVVCRDHTVGV